jgi:hypothetical protein
MRNFSVITMVLGLCCGVGSAEEASRPAAVGVEEAGYFDRPCSTVATGHFTLIHDMRVDEAAEIAGVLEFAYTHFESCFGGYGFDLQVSEEPLVWLCFRKPESFQDYAFATENADLSWLSGYYSSRTNRVAVVRPSRIRRWRLSARPAADVAGRVDDGVDDGLVKIVHEAGHQLAFNTGLLKRGVMYPLWASEGVALAFEDCAGDYVPGGRYSEARKSRLLELHRGGALAPLEEFVVLPSLPADGSDADIYAQAWGFFRFLCEKRPAELKDYFSYLCSLNSGRRSTYRLRREFVESFGEIAELNRQWLAYLELPLVSKPYVCAAPLPSDDQSPKD